MVLKYMNGVGKGMEINTAVLLYKALIRLIFDYGSMVYFPEKEEAGEKQRRYNSKD